MAQTAGRPNIILLMSDDVGWGDLGCYGGSENREAPTPHLDRLAAEGLQFMSFYGQPSCTPGRAAAMTGRLPIRSGMTTVTLPGQPGGLVAAEWTLASVLKETGYSTIQIGKWHLGEEDYSMPTEHGFDEMRNTTLYHLNAYTYTDSAFNPDFPFDDKRMTATWGNVIGTIEGNAGEKWHEVEKLDSKNIPFLDRKSIGHAVDYLEAHAKHENPFFMYLNTAKLHQPNLPLPDFVGKSMAKSKYLDSLVELDHHVGQVVDKVRELGIARKHADLLDDGQRRLAGRVPGLRLHAVQGHQGHRLRGRQPRPGDRMVAGHDRTRAAQLGDRRLTRLHGDVREPHQDRAADRGQGGTTDDVRQLRPGSGSPATGGCVNQGHERQRFTTELAGACQWVPTLRLLVLC